MIDTTMSDYQVFLAYRSIVLNTVKELLIFDAEEGRIRISIIHFAETIVVEVPFDVEMSEELLLRKISEIQHQPGVPTHSPEAVHVASDTLSRFGRPEARPILALFTSSPEIVITADAAMRFGVQLFVVYLAAARLPVMSNARIYTRDSLPLFTVDMRLITNTVPCTQFLHPAPRDRDLNDEDLEKTAPNRIDLQAIVTATVPTFPAEFDTSEYDDHKGYANSLLQIAKTFSSSPPSPPPDSIKKLREDCDNSPVDILLLIDTSSRVKPREFIDQKKLAKNIIEHLFEVAPNDLSIALITFDDYAQYQLTLNPYRDKNTVLEAVSRLVHNSGLTSTADAIHLAIDELERAGRNDSTQIIVLFNSGNSKDAWPMVKLFCFFNP